MNWHAMNWRAINWRAVRAIVRKDLKVALQNKGVSIPLIVVPAIFMVILPALAALVPLFEGDLAGPLQDFETFLERMPVGLQSELAGYDEAQTLIVLILVYFFAPFYLILPLMVASVIAADSSSSRPSWAARLRYHRSARPIPCQKIRKAMTAPMTK